jgi:hypothetical protein
MAVKTAYLPTDEATTKKYRYFVCGTPAELPGAADSQEADLAYASGTPYIATAPGVWAEVFASGSSVTTIGKTIIVDGTFGDDLTGLRERLDKPFASVSVALAVAQSGDGIFIRNGTYNDSFTIPDGVCVRGSCIGGVTIQKLGVTANTTLVTMGENSRLEDVALKLTSSGHYTLTGVKFGGTTSATAKLRTATVTVDNSGAGAGSSDVTGILVQSSGTPGREINAIRAVTATVLSAGSGKKRGLLSDTTAGNFFSRDSNFVARGGTDAIAIEVNQAGSLIGIVTGVAEGDTADVSQTAGSLELGQIDLIHSNANGKGFTATQISFSVVWADPGGVPSNATRYLRPGSATMAIAEIKLNVPRKAVIKKLHVRAASGPGAGKSDVFTVRKNGVDTGLTVTLSDTNTIVSDDAVSVSFSANDDVSLKLVTAVASATTDIVCVVEMY